MTNFNTASAAQTVSASTILPSEKLNIMNQIANIVITKAETRTTREFTGMTRNPKKGGKGMVKRHKLTVIETGRQVIDTQATVAARRAAAKALLSGKKVVIDNAAVRAQVTARIEAKSSIAQAKLDRQDAHNYSIWLSSQAGQIKRIEEQLSVLRAVTPSTSYGKARRNDAPKARVKTARVRTGSKPARLTVAHNQVSVFVKFPAITVRPSSGVKVTRAEAQAIARASKAGARPSNATSTFAIVQQLTKVNNLVLTALEAIASGELFVAAAQARINSTKNTLPAVAQALTMNANNNSIRLDLILSTSREDAIKYFNQEVNQIETLAQFEAEDGVDYADALADLVYDWNKEHTLADLALILVATDDVEGYIHNGGYQEYADKLDMTISDYINSGSYDESCFPFGRENRSTDGKSIDRPVINGAGEKLDKNPSVEINPSEETNTMSNTTVQSTMFNTAFDAPYSEVQPLISFGGIPSRIVNHEGIGANFAEILASILFNVVTEEEYIAKIKRNYKNPSDEMIAKKWATQAKVTARAVEARDSFLAVFSGKLGSIAPCSLAFEQTGVINMTAFPGTIRKFVEAAFSIVKIKSNGDREFSGVANNPANPEYMLPTNIGGFWTAIIAAATYNLSAEERAELLGFLFNNCASVQGAVVKRDRVSIDLLNATVNTGSRVLKANKASCFGSLIDNAHTEYIVLDGNHSIFMFALSALAGTSKQLETRINLAVKLFMPEHNYGHKPDADDIAHFVRTNLVYANGVNLIADDFFGLEFLGGKQAPSFLAWCLNRGVIAASDKTNIKFVTINDGAEATGLGWNRELDRIITPNDVNKVAKLINRGAANNYDCADLDDRVASNFGFGLQSGGVAKTKGKMLDVAFTNSKLGFGSGVGVINPETYITYYVGKSETESFTLSIFGKKFMNHANNKEALINKINEKIEAARGEMFSPKQTIVEVTVDGVKHKLVRNSSDAASIRVVSGSVSGVANDENSIEISINVEIVETTQWVKTRRFATKFTTIPYAVEFVGLNNHWDMLLNNECTKGHGALLEMFANDKGEHVLNTAEGKLIAADASEINLYDENNAVQEWKESKRLEDVKIRMSIAKSVFDGIAKAGNAEEGRSFFDSVKVISEGKTFEGHEYVLVEETIDVIFGQLVFDVEISTALESVSKSNFTLESAAAVSIQDRELGDCLFAESIAKTSSFVALAKEFAGSSDVTPSVIDATTENMAAITAEIFPNGTVGIKHRKLVSTIASFFSGQNEYKFYAGNAKTPKSFKLDLNIVAIYGSFSASSGAASRETATIVNFIVDLFINGVTKFDNNVVYALKSAYNAIINTAVESNKVLKKATRSGELVYGKVRTSFHPMLHSADGIPTVILNRNCPIVRLLGVKDWDSFVNYYVGFTRTPMPFLGAGRLVLTDDDQVCGIAHVIVDPLVWHALNEGDSDGDGIAVINLETINGYQVTTEKVEAINASKMGIAGYEYLYGDNVPFIDFISEEDKQGKKSLRGSACLLNSQLKDPETGEKVYISSAYLGDFAARVAKHYKSAVGVSYGMCSKLIFDAADRATGPDAARFDNLVDASLIAWRAIYEGLGLSGYSKNAELFFNILNATTSDTKFKMVWSPMANWKQVDVRFETPDSEWCAGDILLKSAIKEIVGVDLPLAVFTELVNSRIVTRVMPKLEGYGQVTKWWQDGVTGAVKFGALRRISQGSQRAAYEFGFIEEAEFATSGQFVAKPLAVIFHEENYGNLFDNPLLAELTTGICEFHNIIRDGKQALIDQALYGVGQ